MGEGRKVGNNSQLPNPPIPRLPILGVIIGLIAFFFAWKQIGIGESNIFNPGGLELLGRFFGASLHPDLSAEFLQLTCTETVTTLAYAVCGSFLSVTVGLIGGIWASQVWWWGLLRRQPGGNYIFLVVRAGLAVPRAIHELLWGLFFVNIWGLDPLCAIFAIAIPFGAVTAKVFSEILDETPREPYQALLNSGVAPAQAFLYTLLPQATLNLVSYTCYRFECSLRSAAVLGIIGAGGLGEQIYLSLQSLRYEQLWTLFYALFILNGTVDWASAWLRHRLGCVTRLDLNQGKLGKREARAGYGRDWLLGIIGGGILLLIPSCFWYVKPDFTKIWSPHSQRFFVTIGTFNVPKDVSIIQLKELFHLSTQTLAMSILAITIAGLWGIFLSFPAARNFGLPLGNRGRLWRIPTRIFLLICRGIPAPIWALVALFIMFPGILPGAVALGIHNLGILGRLMAEVVENLEKPPLEALQAQGINPEFIFLYGVLPMTLPRFLAYIFYRWEVCLRETIIVGLVGAGGLGRLLSEQLSSFDTEGILLTLVCLVLLTFFVDSVSGVARRSLR